eukprot:SAG11_NODE_1851_length_4167_cov_1.585054_2_plen_98_part_00
MIFRQGDIGSEFYFILDGELEIRQNGVALGFLWCAARPLPKSRSSTESRQEEIFLSRSLGLDKHLRRILWRGRRRVGGGGEGAPQSQRNCLTSIFRC